MDTEKVGRRLQTVRRSRGLTQAALAEMAGLTPKYVSNIECGFKTPKLDTFVTIANALRCDANSLLCDVLDVAVGQESGLISQKLSSLPVEQQRYILRVMEFMIDELSTKKKKKIPPRHKNVRGDIFSSHNISTLYF